MAAGIDAPITVIGAGPSGLASAIVLARGGRRVIVRERRRNVGARFHGDFQGLENWSAERDVLDEFRDLGVPVEAPLHPVYRGEAYDFMGRRFPVSDDKPLYYLLRRGPGGGTLDEALLKEARAAGAEIRFGDEVRRAPKNAVIATGPRRADIIASGYTFRTEMDDAQHVCFDNRLAPWGYAYLLIADGRGTLAVCMFRDFKRHRECLEAAKAFFQQHSGLVMCDPKPFGGYGMLSRITRVERKGRRLVGERAGLQDGLAGFGLRYAITSGALAAQSFLGGASYEKLLRRRLGSIHSAGVVNRLVFQVVGDKGRAWALARLSECVGRRGLRRLYRGSLVHRALFPIAAAGFGDRLNHPGCRHVDCDCTWCRMTEKRDRPPDLQL